MARGTRDVELVVRAKNEASKTLDAITSSFVGLTKAQTSVSAGATKTGSVLSQLGTQLQLLNKSFGGASPLDKIAGSMLKATSAVLGLENGLTKIAEEAVKLDTDIAKADASVLKFAADADRLKSSLVGQKSVVESTKAQFAELAKAVKAGETALAGRQSKEQGFIDALGRQENALAKTGQKQKEYAATILSAAEPTSKQLDNFEKTDAKLRSQAETLAKTKASYSDYINRIREISTTLPGMRTSLEATSVALKTAEAAQRETAASLKAVETSGREASKNLTKLRDAADKNAEAMNRQEKSLVDARQELTKVEATATQAGIALSKVGSNIRQGLLRELANAKTDLAGFRDAWLQAQAAVKASTMGGAKITKVDGQATSTDPGLVANLEIAKQSKAAYLQMQQAINTMRNAARDAGTDVTRLAAAQQQFQTALEGVKVKSDALAATQRQQLAISQALGTSTVTSANRQATAYNNTANASARLAREAKNSEVALSDLENRGRAAMTWAQRLHGEMIALAMSFVGVYAAINQMKAALDVAMQVDAAKAKLTVVTDGNQKQAAAELKFVRSEADRLGISFVTLAKNYSGLALSSKDTELSGEEVRQVFTGLTEAFRVYNLSAAQVDLAMNGVNQSFSKGQVMAEEFKQQFAERIPGAMQIAAKAMGKTTQEFMKMMEAGQINPADFWPKFVTEMNKSVGPQLSASLQNIAADVGKFENEVAKARLAFDNGGFTEGLQAALRELTKQFQSKDGQAFFANLGKVVGGFLEILAQVPKYGNEVALVFGIIVAHKLPGFLAAASTAALNLVNSFKPIPSGARAAAVSYDALGVALSSSAAKATWLDRQFIAMNASLAASRAAATSSAAGLAVLQGAVNGAARAVGIFRGVLAGLGGIPGLIITGLTVALGYWMTSTEKATGALEEHQRQMGLILEAYDEAAKKGGKWVDSLKGLTTLDIKANLDDLLKQFNEQKLSAIDKFSSRLGGTISLKRGNMGEIGKDIAELIQQARDGKISMAEFREQISKISEIKGVNPAIVDAAKAFSKVTGEAATTEAAIAKTVRALMDAGSSVEGVSPAIIALANDLKTLGSTADDAMQKPIDPSKRLAEQIDILRGKIPSLTDEIKLMESLKEIDEILKTADAIKGLDKTSEAYKRLMSLANQAKSELQLAFDAKQFKGLETMLAGVSSSVEASAKLLRNFEGFIGKPKWDVNAYRAGFGSDTVTLADGSIQKITKGMSVSIEDANRDLVRRIGEFQSTVKGQIGADRFNGFTTEQQAVLTSIAYNYGSLPQRIIEAVKTGSADEIASAIRGLAPDNGGINAKRRNQEAFLFQSGSDPEAQNKAIEKQIGLIEKRNEKELEYNANLQETLGIKRDELAAETAQNSLPDRATFVRLEVEKAVATAKKAGVILDERSLALAAEVAGQLWEQKKAKEDQVNLQKEQQQGEERISILEQQRRDIIEQMKLAQAGDPSFNYSDLSEKLTTVNSQLTEAIEKMIVFWTNVGGPNADAQIDKLKLLKANLTEVRDRAVVTATDIGNIFGNTLNSAFSGFLDKIRETGDVFGSLKESLQQWLSDFLLAMAKAIAQAAIFNAMMSASKALGGGGSFLGSLFQAAAGAKFHAGGVVGSGGQAMAVSPAWFANARRYHTGGIAGLAANEVPAVLQKGEEVLTSGDPRHVNNGGTAGGQSIKIINTIDSGSMVSEGLSTADGEKALFNFVRANRASLKQALG